MSPIYTRKGDAGETGLGDGRRVPKISDRIEAIGTVDELNSAIGLAISLLPAESSLRGSLTARQHELLQVGARLALPADATADYQTRLPAIEPGSVAAMEELIDTWWAQLPPLDQFILPGGAPAAAALHLARSISRRAERMVLRLGQNEPQIDPFILRWLNRMSDFLFAAARWANHETGFSETRWRKS